jgi:hypothetical protein
LKCLDNECLGYNESDICLSHIECKIGLYCNNITNKCEKLKSINESCTELH